MQTVRNSWNGVCKLTSDTHLKLERNFDLTFKRNENKNQLSINPIAICDSLNF